MSLKGYTVNVMNVSVTIYISSVNIERPNMNQKRGGSIFTLRYALGMNLTEGHL